MITSNFMKPCPICATRWVDQACLSASVRLADSARRQLIAGLLARRHLILSGPAGLGKVRLAKALALCIAQGRPSHVRSIQGHPWWAAKTHDVARFVTMQTDYSLWRLADFVETISSGGPGNGQDYVAFVGQISPVEIELYFGRFVWRLFRREQYGASPIPLRLIGTYNTDTPPPLEDHIKYLSAVVHLDKISRSAHECQERSEKHLVGR